MSSLPFKLRDYQKDALRAIFEAQAQGLKRLLISLPTGAGKTVIFSQLCKDIKKNALILAHRDELLQQAKEKIEKTVGSQKHVSIERAEQTANPKSNIVVASIRSLQTKRIDRLLSENNIQLIIYDECHHAAAEDNKRVLSELGCFSENWNGLLVGFTATPTRADGRSASSRS